MDVNPIKQLYNDYITILNGSVIKYSYEAELYETYENRQAADEYLRARQSLDKFEHYFNYDKDVIRTATGISDDILLNNMVANRDLIPVEFRNTLLSLQRSYIINKYVEANNYYRMLAGLPNIEETTIDFVFVDEHVALEYGVPIGIPIHELDLEYIVLLKTAGYIDVVKARYPTKKYLNFLGSDAIDILTSRPAKDFSLLKVPYDVSETIWNKFVLIYEQCREYFMVCIYVREMRSTIDHYDGFIAMCIMLMTILQILARMLKNAIDREFFDDTAVRNLFAVYGVPYHENMDKNIRMQIVQSLNLLIQNKGTNQVIYDITSILGYDRVTLYKYYLMKTRKFTDTDIPMVVYKTDPSTGKQVPDYTQMYDVYFQKVPIDDMDAYSALIDPSNFVAYDEVTSGDPFWIEDANLQDEIYQNEFNYIETKYMGASISYRMTELMYDNIYLLKMIMDSKSTTSRINITLDRLMVDKPVSLFTTIVILCALTSNYNGLKGEILYDPSKIMHVLGFNFDIDYKTIRYDILSDPYIDDALADYFLERDLTTASKINSLFENYSDLMQIITEKMSTAKTIEVYRAYMKLYKTIFHTEENKELFKVGIDTTRSGDVYPETYMEYIRLTDIEIYEAIANLSKDEISTMITSICMQIEEILPSVSYLGISSGTSSNLETMLLDLVRFFKSYTTDMISFDTIYILDLKAENMLRLIDSMRYHVDIGLEEELKLSYGDTLSVSISYQFKDVLKLIDSVYGMEVLMRLNDYVFFFDVIHSIYTINTCNSYVHFSDFINYIHKEISINTKIKLEDNALLYSEYMLSDKLIFTDVIDNIIFILAFNDMINISDIIAHMQTSSARNTYMNIKDILVSIVNESNFKDYLHFIDTIKLFFLRKINDEHQYYDIIKTIEKINESKDDLKLKDDITSISMLFRFISNLELYDKIHDIYFVNYLNDSFNVRDLLSVVSELLYRGDKVSYSDDLSIERTLSSIYDSLKYHDELTIAYIIELFNYLGMFDIIAIIISNLYHSEKLGYNDILSIEKAIISMKDVLHLNDIADIRYFFEIFENINMNDIMSYNITHSLENRFGIGDSIIGISFSEF